MKRAIIIIIAGLGFQTSWAQPPLTLPEAVNLALRNRLELQIARNNVDAAVINNDIGIAGGLPTVSATITDNETASATSQKLNTGETNKRGLTLGNNLSAAATGSLLLFNGFRVVATKHRLEELQKLSEFQLNSQVQNIIGEVMLQYYDIVRQQDYVRTLTQSIAAAQERLTIIKVKQSVGLANNADLFQAQIDVNTVYQSLQQQSLVIAQAKTALLSFMGLNPDSAIHISDTIVVNRNLDLATVEDALKNYPDYQAAQTQIYINQYIEKETAAQRYPTIRANAGLNYSRSQSAGGLTLLNRSVGPSLGLSVNIPIYNGGIYRRQEQVAQINTRNATLQRDVLYEQLKTQVASSYEAYSSNLIQVDSAYQNYQLAAKLLNLTLLRFRLGQATIIEVRNAQQSFEQQGFQLVNLGYAAKTAEITLDRLAGKLTY